MDHKKYFQCIVLAITYFYTPHLIAISIDHIQDEIISYTENQSIYFIPISIGDIRIMIPIGNGMPNLVEVSNNSLSGVDSDADGLRDDVERRISQQYPNDSLKRAYSYMIAKRLQAIMENNYDINEYLNAIQELTFLEDCLYRDYPDNEIKGVNLILPWVMNTYERSLSYIQSRAVLEGQYLPPSSECQI